MPSQIEMYFGQCLQSFSSRGLDGGWGGGSVSCSRVVAISVLSFTQLPPTKSVFCSVLEIHENAPKSERQNVYGRECSQDKST